MPRPCRTLGSSTHHIIAQRGTCSQVTLESKNGHKGHFNLQVGWLYTMKTAYANAFESTPLMGTLMWALWVCGLCLAASYKGSGKTASKGKDWALISNFGTKVI